MPSSCLVLCVIYLILDPNVAETSLANKKFGTRPTTGSFNCLMLYIRNHISLDQHTLLIVPNVLNSREEIILYCTLDYLITINMSCFIYMLLTCTLLVNFCVAPAILLLPCQPPQ
jgi:hypothetical protein